MLGSKVYDMDDDDDGDDGDDDDDDDVFLTGNRVA